MTIQPDASVMSKARKFLDFFKSVDDATLRDLEVIPSVTDGGEKTGTPSASENGAAGHTICTDGSMASTEIHRNSNLQPQFGVTAEYDRLASQVGGIAKSVAAQGKVLSGLMAAMKADVTAEAATASDPLARALRKARLAVVKAESKDEDEDEDFMEKARAAVKAANEAVTKAEDDAEDDEKEAAAEKARKDLTVLKSRLKAVAEKAAPATNDIKIGEPAAKSATELLAEQVASLTETVKSLTTTPSVTAAPVFTAPPAFVKAAAEFDFATALEEFEDAGAQPHEIVKAEGLVHRLQAAKAGRVSMPDTIALIKSAEPRIARLFAPLIDVAA